MRFPPQWLDELRARADIVKIISSYTQLKKNGHRYVGLCPFHNEKTPSFSVDEQKQLYYCFGCKAAGSVIQFVMEKEHLTFPEAVTMLAEQCNMPLPEMANDPDYERRRGQRERLYMANQAAARLYHQQLWTDNGKPALDYLKGRGLSDSVIRRFGLGAATGLSVTSALMEQGFTQQELVMAGLTIEKNGRVYDMFRNRAMFPIIDAYGHVLGFGGRILGEGQPKYLNTSDTPAFNKRYNVFAANLLRKARGLKRVLLVEGYMDVVALSQYGVEGAAATLGTALTPEQARLMHRYAPEIHIAYDGDSAGQKAILRALDILRQEGVPCRVLVFPDNLDPDEFLRQRGMEAFEALMSITGVQYRMDRQRERFDMASEEGRTEYAKACAAILREVKEPVELENYVRRLSIDTGFTREVLLAQIGTGGKLENTPPPNREAFQQKARTEQPFDRTAATLLAVLATGRLPKGSVTAEEFDDPQLRALCEGLLAGDNPAALMEEQPDDRSRELASRVLSIPVADDDDTLLRMARECLYNMRRQRLEAQVLSIEKEIPNLPQEARSGREQELYRLSKRLMELKP